MVKLTKDETKWQAQRWGYIPSPLPLRPSTNSRDFVNAVNVSMLNWAAVIESIYAILLLAGSNITLSLSMEWEIELVSCGHRVFFFSRSLFVSPNELNREYRGEQRKKNIFKQRRAVSLTNLSQRSKSH